MTTMLNASTLMAVLLGNKVEKEVVSLADADLFTVYGKVAITLLIGEVTGVGDGGATTIKLNEKASSIDLCAATTVTGDAVGELYVLTGDPTVILGGTGSVPTLKVVGFLSAFPHDPVVFDGQAGLVIELTQTGADATHKVLWTMFYVPLEAGAYVEAA